MIIVCDTSPLLNLAAIGRLDVLPAVHGSVVVPRAVMEELHAGDSAANPWLSHAWLQVGSVSDRREVEVLEASLDKGEAEAIVLGLEMNADLLLCDETAGRREARRRGLQVIGLLGTLIAAKHRSIVPALRPILDSLRTQAGFWLSGRMYEHAIELAGEQ